MIIDALLQFDTAINLAQVTGTYNSTNVLDLGGNFWNPLSASGGGARDLSIGDDPALKMYITVTTAFTSGGSATLQVVLQGAPDNGSAAPGTWFTMAQSPAIAVAALAQGATILDGDIPGVPPGQPLPRFLRLQYIIATAAMTAGVIEAYIALDRFDQIMSSAGFLSGYPVGIVITN